MGERQLQQPQQATTALSIQLRGRGISSSCTIHHRGPRMFSKRRESYVVPVVFTRRQNSEAQESHEAFPSIPLPHVTVYTLQAHTHAQTPTAELVSKSGQSSRHSPHPTPASVDAIRLQPDRVLGKAWAQLA